MVIVQFTDRREKELDSEPNLILLVSAKSMTYRDNRILGR